MKMQSVVRYSILIAIGTGIGWVGRSVIRPPLDTEALSLGVEIVRGKNRTLNDYSFLFYSLSEAMKQAESGNKVSAKSVRAINEALNEVSQNEIKKLLMEKVSGSGGSK